MKRFIQAILAALGLCSGCSKSDILSPNQFTSEIAEAFRKSSPEFKVEIVREMEVKLTTIDGRETTSFLNNAYDVYKQDPKSKKDVIQRYVTSGLETIASLKLPAALDSTRIIPIIKDRPWLEEYRKALMSRGAKVVPEPVYEELNSDLIIVYAEDSPKNISYFQPNDLEKFHINRQDLRDLACKNLKRLLTNIERHGTNGLYMITAGGDYEASLLLLDSVWSDVEKDVHGEIVVAIPTRDLLVVTGSQDTEGLKKMRDIVHRATAQGSYRLTTKLFVLRGGNLKEFSQ
ncbi:MAG: hypothetical protein JWM68_5238 [Verrucomicrobiales bacterium]|nr:hypothetical protein [Verrucomicrobiales bacterium]